MNANFGILPHLEEEIKDKQKRYKKLADVSLENLGNILSKNSEVLLPKS